MKGNDHNWFTILKVNENANYYEILGISQSASQEEIRKAYRTQARICHPDKIKSKDSDIKQACNDAFLKISEAYETLTDNSKRQIYDIKLTQIPATQSSSSEPRMNMKHARNLYEELVRTGISVGYEIGQDFGGVPGAIFGAFVGGALAIAGGELLKLERGNKLANAVANNDQEQIDTLLEEDILLNEQSDEIKGYRGTALHWAIKHNNLELFARLIEKGADKDIEDISGDTAFGLSLKHPGSGIYKLIIENDKKVKGNKARFGKVAFFYAVSEKDYEMCKWLLENILSVNTRYIEGNTPLHQAVLHKDYEMCEWLLNKGANINIPNKYDETPLALALEDNNPRLHTLLISRGANPNTQGGQYRKTALYYAAINNDNDSCEWLLSHGANVNIPDIYGNTANPNTQGGQYRKTALYYAAINNDNDSCEWLLSHGANVNIPDIYGNTILHNLVIQGNYDMCAWFLNNGAAVNISNKCGETPLSLALKYNNPKIHTLLMERGANLNTALYYAVSYNNNQMCNLLLSRQGVNINIQDSYGRTPLHWAVSYNNNAMCDLLLSQQGVNVNIQDSYGNIPLHLTSTALSQGNINLQIIDALINAGSNLNTRNIYGIPAITPQSWQQIQNIRKFEKLNINNGFERG
ncbi:ankyrin repeat domain-containing protein [Holosporaceae bacterium 'Namur']|nr:ankyrin repeat domain-containing protein [Holosporaceae bacterium 'Namur']